VIGTVTGDSSPTITTTTPTTTAPTVTKPVTTYEPTMPGIADNCDVFYQVSSGDQYDVIAAKYGISEVQLRSCNSQIDASAFPNFFPFVLPFRDFDTVLFT
jgi:hypothetical protein